MSSKRVAVAAALAISLIAGTAQAGGSAHVNILAVPKQVKAGQVFDLAFAVHPDWPMSKARALQPTVKAVCGDQVLNIATAEAKDGKSYIASFAVPAAGDWTITVDSRFCQTRMTPLVLKAVSPKSRQS